MTPDDRLCPDCGYFVSTHALHKHGLCPVVRFKSIDIRGPAPFGSCNGCIAWFTCQKEGGCLYPTIPTPKS